jgi:hypothetical protein
MHMPDHSCRRVIADSVAASTGQAARLFAAAAAAAADAATAAGPTPHMGGLDGRRERQRQRGGLLAVPPVQLEELALTSPLLAMSASWGTEPLVQV